MRLTPNSLINILSCYQNLPAMWLNYGSKYCQNLSVNLLLSFPTLTAKPKTQKWLFLFHSFSLAQSLTQTTGTASKTQIYVKIKLQRCLPCAIKLKKRSYSYLCNERDVKTERSVVPLGVFQRNVVSRQVFVRFLRFCRTLISSLLYTHVLF